MPTSSEGGREEGGGRGRGREREREREREGGRDGGGREGGVSANLFPTDAAGPSLTRSGTVSTTNQ